MAAISDKAIKKNTTPYKYNAGSELEEELNYYSTFYRKYDAQIGRFTGVDPKATATAGLNPYQFGNNNPIMYNDPMGDLSQADWNDFLDRLGSGSNLDGFGVYGGTYGGGSGGGGFNAFSSRDEAFVWGVENMNASGGWGSHPGWANSAGGALERYNGGQTTPGIVAAFYSITYASSMSNVSATAANGGFNINYTSTSSGNNNVHFESIESIQKSLNFLSNLYGNSEGEKSGWDKAGFVTETAGLTLETTEQTVIGAQRLANSLSGETAEILKGGKIVEAASRDLALAGAAITLIDGYQNGFKAHHYADLAVDAGIYGLSASIPVAGWLFGATYFIVNAIVEAKTGQSITENLFDSGKY